MSRASTPEHAISSAFSGGTSGISNALMGSRSVVGQTCPKHRALLEAPLQHGYTLDNSIAPCLPSWAAADHQRAVGVFSAFRPSQPALPSSCRNAGMFSSRPPEHDAPSRGEALNSMTHRRHARFFYRDWISVLSKFFGSQIHTVNRIATTITRPKFSISVRYFHLRLEAADNGWGIRVNQSEALSNSHQPQT
jgi:hypothetical protein